MTDQKFELMCVNTFGVVMALLLAPMVVLVMVMIVKAISHVAQS